MKSFQGLRGRQGLVAYSGLVGYEGLFTEKPPVIHIDYVNQRYYEYGVPKLLSEVSTFGRLSKATKWDSGSLVEVEVDEPRIDADGLLVEEQRTNILPQSQNIASVLWREIRCTVTEDVGVASPVAGGVVYKLVSTAMDSYIDQTINVSAGYYSFSLLAKGIIGEKVFLQIVNSVSPFEQFGSGVYDVTSDGFSLYSVSGYIPVGVSSVRFRLRHSSLIQYSSEMYIAYFQAEQGEFPTSYVPTTTSPVTRSPDILNIPLLPTQTLAGDWDAGVTYTVAGGIATFTGHGYIRNIAVEEL